MNPSIDPLLIAARTSEAKDNFTRSVMQNIATLPSPSKKKGAALLYFRSLQPAYLVVLFVLSVIALSGVSYAAYRLWLAPQVSITHEERNDRGNQEFAFSLQNCDIGAIGLEASEELAQDDVTKQIHAECERSAIRDWAQSEWKYMTESTTLSTNSVSAFSHVSGDAIFFNEGYIKEATVSKTTKVIIDGVESQLHNLKQGDTIILVERLHYGPERGHPTFREVLALVKVTLPLKYYSLGNQAHLRKQFRCFKTLEQCVDHPMIEVYSAGKPGDATLQAKTTKINADHSLSLKARSGTEYRLELDPTIIPEFNNIRAPQHYTGHAIKEGAWLDLSFIYNEDTPTTITPTQLRVMHIFTNTSNPKKDQ